MYFWWWSWQLSLVFFCRVALLLLSIMWLKIMLQLSSALNNGDTNIRSNSPVSCSSFSLHLPYSSYCLSFSHCFFPFALSLQSIISSLYLNLMNYELALYYYHVAPMPSLFRRIYAWSLYWDYPCLMRVIGCALEHWSYLFYIIVSISICFFLLWIIFKSIEKQ